MIYSHGLKRGPKPKDKAKQIQDSGSSASELSSEDEGEENREKPFLRKSLRKKRKKKKNKNETPAFLIQTASGRTPKATLRYSSSTLISHSMNVKLSDMSQKMQNLLLRKPKKLKKLVALKNLLKSIKKLRNQIMNQPPRK